MIGQTVSHYRILEKLGGGGMGVVYKAEDLRLGRHVSLKFLPEELSREPLAIERFQREARAASSLNHPHICTIYDVDQYEGQSFIVMEYLEGHTLKHSISGKPMDIERIPEYGYQMADALEAAVAAGAEFPRRRIVRWTGIARLVLEGRRSGLRFKIDRCVGPVHAIDMGFVASAHYPGRKKADHRLPETRSRIHETCEDISCPKHWRHC